MEIDEQIEELVPRLLGYCLGRLGDRSLAEEICQEALAALVDRWRRHGPPESPAAFAFAVARRRAGRLAWRQRLLAPFQGSENGDRRPPAPDERYEQRQRLERVLAALTRLPAGERESLLLVAVGELGTAEAARLQGVSRSAVKMRVHRARRRLEGWMEVDDGK